MHTYIHKVNYYETDKMGITHHSNYVRWMEEARMDFLKSIGYGMRKLEADGITSPVVSVECQYKSTTTFDDEIKIELSIEKYTGVKLEMSYIMTNLQTGAIVLTARSSHCFIDSKGRPIAVKKHFPEFDAELSQIYLTNSNSLH
ncbi:MAG: acyl-CoA thioesterase [Clostridia bacterium]|nr:acyl-CoA thioesterase [Clostridia bacterium]